MGFHNLSHFEKFRKRCKESRSETQRANNNLQYALILYGKSGHAKIGSSRDGAYEYDRQSQALVPLAVVMHAMRMQPFIAKGIVGPFDQEFFLRIRPRQCNFGRTNGARLGAAFCHSVC